MNSPSFSIIDRISTCLQGFVPVNLQDVNSCGHTASLFDDSSKRRAIHSGLNLSVSFRVAAAAAAACLFSAYPIGLMLFPSHSRPLIPLVLFRIPHQLYPGSDQYNLISPPLPLICPLFSVLCISRMVFLHCPRLLQIHTHLLIHPHSHFITRSAHSFVTLLVLYIPFEN